jgi:hypothetical protein
VSLNLNGSRFSSGFTVDVSIAAKLRKRENGNGTEEKKYLVRYNWPAQDFPDMS